MNKSIGAVIVTYNRLSKLKFALECYSIQTLKPQYVIVVDNASNDGTAEYLDEWEKKAEGFDKIVITNSFNKGGSGGFYDGLKEASGQKADWIFVADDDAFPEINTFAIANKFIIENDCENVAAICGAVINNGQYDIQHRMRFIKKGLNVKIEYPCIDEYTNNFAINGFSYVGTIINKEMLKAVGLTRKDFFIWADDAEHSLRLSRVGKIICIPSMRIIHDQPKNIDNPLFSWKTYYGIRNNYVMYRTLFSKQCAEYYVMKKAVSLMKRVVVYRADHTEKENLLLLFRTAVKDGRQNSMGMSPIYKPGWKIERK